MLLLDAIILFLLSNVRVQNPRYPQHGPFGQLLTFVLKQIKLQHAPGLSKLQLPPGATQAGGVVHAVVVVTALTV